MRFEPLLRRAAALAAGTGLDVLPDPPVGCLLLSGAGAEGIHRRHGGPHAEAEALDVAGRRARGATAVVTLEPCADGPGKRTPSCARALIAAGVARVVYGAKDPSPTAAGRGPALLRAAGIEVRHVPSPECAALLRRWRAALADPLPWTIAKWAMTLDGKIADAEGGSRWISGAASRARAHALRAGCDAVVIGARTARVDDPDLRPRPARRGRTPVRVVVDGALRLPTRGRLVATAREGPVLVAALRSAPAARRRALERAGVEVLVVTGREGRVDLRELLLALRTRGIRRVLLEGGGEIHAAAFAAGVVRQAAVFVAPSILGGRAAPTAVGGDEGLRRAADPLRLEEVRVLTLGEDRLIEGFVPGE